MRMHEIPFEGPSPIDSYGAGGFRLAGTFHAGGLALTPERREAWPVESPAALTEKAFARFIEIADEIDVLLVGTGPEIAALPSGARTALEEVGIGVETMSTASACRTFNVLLAEGRRVAAALIAV